MDSLHNSHQEKKKKKKTKRQEKLYTSMDHNATQHISRRDHEFFSFSHDRTTNVIVSCPFSSLYTVTGKKGTKATFLPLL